MYSIALCDDEEKELERIENFLISYQAGSRVSNRKVFQCRSFTAAGQGEWIYAGCFAAGYIYVR